MTASNAGAPLGNRSAAQASSSQPTIPNAALTALSSRSHASSQTASANQRRPGAADGAGTGFVAARLATCTVSALPACCTGARKVKSSGVLTGSGFDQGKQLHERNRGDGQRAQSRQPRRADVAA